VSEERKKIPQRRRDHPNDITVGWMPFIDEQGRTYYVSFQYNVQTYYPPWETKYNVPCPACPPWLPSHSPHDACVRAHGSVATCHREGSL
jgi:hypothetical protein